MDLPSPGAPVHPVLSARMRWGLFFAIVGALLCIRLSSPSDLADGYHQERAAAYVIDAVENRNWICQHGADGQITSKPPLYTWLSGLATLVIGRPTWAGLVLSSALAMLITAAVLWRLGRNFGAWAGFLAALIYLVS